MTVPPPDWPRREASHFLRLSPHEWHVQIFGSGPDVLALHGAGASSHSFHPLIAHLPGYRLIVPDLPGQGLTRAGGTMRLGLDAMADDLNALCQSQGWRPQAILGHSAGAAVALRMAEVMPNPPASVVGLNAALGPFGGFEGWLFPKLARAMSASPFIAALVTRFSASGRQVERLLAGTGSSLDADGVANYRRLVARTSHIEGTLGMMAQWQLEPLLERLPQNFVSCLLLASSNDRAVPPEVSKNAALRLPDCTYVELPGYGHLMHEEAPGEVVQFVRPFLDTHTKAPRLVR